MPVGVHGKSIRHHGKGRNGGLSISRPLSFYATRFVAVGITNNSAGSTIIRSLLLKLLVVRNSMATPSAATTPVRPSKHLVLIWNEVFNDLFYGESGGARTLDTLLKRQML